MRRRFVLSAILASLVVITLPASASAMTYRYQVLQNYCYGASDSYVYFKVKMIKPAGYSSADTFTIDGTAQHKNVFGGSWKTEYRYSRAVHYLNGGYAKETWSQWYWREPDDTYRFHRIHLVLKVWAYGSLLASKPLNSTYC